MSDAVADEREPKVDRKGIWGWMFFDWAAQPFHTLILTFIFAPYFASSVAESAAIGQAQWGYAAGAAGLVIAFLSPVLGAIADATGPRKPWIFGFSILAIFGSFALWWALPNSLDGGSVLFVLVAFAIAMFGFEFAAVFNNAMMPDLVPRAKLGRLSGNAWALGYGAGLLTLIIVLLTMATNKEGLTLLGSEPLFGIDAEAKEGERATGPLTAIWFVIFVLPLFFFTPDTPKRERVAGAVQKGLSQLWNTIRNLPNNKSMFAYLGSSMIYRDALNGLYTFGGIYAVGVLEWSIVQVGIFGILANITGIGGALIGGRLDDKRGPKFVVTLSVVLLAIASMIVITLDPGHVLLFPVEANSSLPDIVFYVCGGLIGACGGALQAASRTLMADQAEPGRMTEAFGLYALSGRATAFLAPFLIAFFTDFTASQRIGVTPVIALFILSLVLLPMVKQNRVNA
ncbi:MAG: MFS transporter [Pseudomonadota bacterium]